ncbi:hypothetical protein DW1_0834 [Proteiniborus sp. DW1]|nr:hypothetical protein DW1_0834 [Proteiniborus sp. DW1]
MITYKVYSDDSKHFEIGDGFFEGWPNLLQDVIG